MALTRLQGLRFFKLFDPLTVYGNACLAVVEEEELLDGSVRGINESAQAKVAYELWQNLDVIDSFIEENPANMSFGELQTIRQWRDGITGMFYIWRFPDGELRFMGDGYAFEVCGLSKEIEDMVQTVPAVVHTTLLPFENRIVYSEYLGVTPIQFGDGMMKMLQKTADETYEAGLFIRNADELMRVAPEIKERAFQRESEQMLADLENEQRIDEPGTGQHRGVLAGMTPDERAAAIKRQFESDSDWGSFNVVEALKERCTEGPITASLQELLERMNLPTVDEFATEMEKRFPDYDSEEANEAVQSLLETVRDLDTEVLFEHLTNPEGLQAVMVQQGATRLAALRNLVEHNGRLRYTEDGLKTLGDKPPAVRGVCHIFHEDGMFDYVMPDEVLEAARSIDWEAAEKAAGWHADFVNFFDVIAELRGIMPYTEAIDEYARVYPGRFEDAQGIHDELIDAVEDEECGASLVDTGDEVYLLHYELFWEWCRERGIDWHYAGPVEEGPLGELLKGLLSQQRGKSPRAVTAEMLQAQSLFDWKESQPCCRAMRDFLDAHVPDARNDYYFADKVMEELIDETKWGLTKDGARFLFDVLEENDFVPEEHQIQTLLNLWMNMGNALPAWPNNGWSPNDLLSEDLGRPVFFNEDGSIMKVGRNDPCPCGSGKKYKKCCGR